MCGAGAARPASDLLLPVTVCYCLLLCVGQVLLVRRQVLGSIPARNIKFLGNLQGKPDEWGAAFAAAQARAREAGLFLSVFRRYDELHLSNHGGIDSNHCLHLFNHFRPAGKKMIAKWEAHLLAPSRTFSHRLTPSHTFSHRLTPPQDPPHLPRPGGRRTTRSRSTARTTGSTASRSSSPRRR